MLKTQLHIHQDKKHYLASMSYTNRYTPIRSLCMFLLLTLITTNAFAQKEEGAKQHKNTSTVGFMIGPVATYTITPNSSRYYNSGYDGGPGAAFTIGFVAEQYFNRSRPHLYFSIGERLQSTYFETYQNNYYPYSSQYPYVYQTDHMLIGNVGVSAGLNWDIVRGKKAALTVQLAAVPMAEAGNFKGNYQANVAGEGYLGGTFMKRVSLGLRMSHRFVGYEYDYNSSFAGDTYRITAFTFDLRFRINGGGSSYSSHYDRN